MIKIKLFVMSINKDPYECYVVIHTCAHNFVMESSYEFSYRPSQM